MDSIINDFLQKLSFLVPDDIEVPISIGLEFLIIAFFCVIVVFPLLWKYISEHPLSAVIIVLVALLLIILILSVTNVTDDGGGTTSTVTPIHPNAASLSPAPTPSPTVLVKIESYNMIKDEYDYLLFGRYKQERTDEPILWRVLQVKNGGALLLSEYILDTKRFDSDSNSWEKSEIKRWLNTEFRANAFSVSEELAICDNGEIGDIFLLSKNEFLRPEYGFSSYEQVQDRKRIASGTTHALNNNLWMNSKDRCSCYYMRSVPNRTNVDMIRNDGTVGIARVTRDDIGIRPAMWVDISALGLTEGNGTKESPYR